MQRKALTQRLRALAGVEDRLGFHQYWKAIAKPLDGRYTKDDLGPLIRQLDAQAAALRPAA